MQATVKLPKAFSLRDENEFYPVQHLMGAAQSEIAGRPRDNRKARRRRPHGNLGDRLSRWAAAQPSSR